MDREAPVSAARVRAELQRFVDRGESGTYATGTAVVQRDVARLESMLKYQLAPADRFDAVLLLAKLRMTCFEQGDAGSLDRVIELLSPLERDLDPSVTNGAAGLKLLAAALIRDCERSGNPRVVARAIGVMRRLIRGHRGTPDDWSLLGYLLAHRHALTGELTCLVEAVKICDKAMAMPSGAGDLLVLMRRASVYTTWADYTNTDDDFHKAFAAHRLALDHFDDLDPACAHAYSNYGALIIQYSNRRLAGSRLDEAVDVCRRAVAFARDGDPDLARYFVNLGAALITRYEQTGDPVSLTDSLSAYSDATAHASPSHPQYDRALGGRAGALLRLVEMRNDERAANEAVTLAQAAVDVTPSVHPSLPTRLGILAGALVRRHENIAANVSDLDRAHEALQSAILPLLATDDRRAMFESNLGAVRSSRFEVTNDVADLDAAIDAHVRATDLTPAAHIELGGRLASLAVDQARRGVATMDAQQCAEAVSTARRAIDASPPGHVASNHALVALAEAFEACYRCSKDPSDGHAALDAYRCAVAGTIGVNFRIRAALGLGRFAAELNDYEQALAGYTTAVEAMDQAASHTMWRRDQERVLTMLTGVPQDAAAMAINTAGEARAVELLEQGRGLLLTRANQTGIGADRIRDLQPDLAERLRRTSHVLGALDRTTDSSPFHGEAPEVSQLLRGLTVP